MAGPREQKLLLEIEQDKAQRAAEAAVRAAQATTMAELERIGSESRNKSALLQVRFGDAEELRQQQEQAKAKQDKSKGQPPLDVAGSTRAFQTKPDGPPGDVSQIGPRFGERGGVGAAGGADAQNRLQQLTSQGQGGPQTVDGFQVPATTTELQTRSGVRSFDTPSAILRAPFQESQFVTKPNVLTPGQALTAQIGQERNRLAAEKQRLDQLQTKVESDSSDGAAVLSRMSTGDLPDGSFAKVIEALAEREGPVHAAKVERQARFQHLREQTEFDQKLALKNRAKTSAVKNLEAMRRHLKAGNIQAARQLAALIVPQGTQIRIGADGSIEVSQGSVGNLRQRTEAQDNLFAAEHSFNALTSLREAIEADPTLAGTVGQFKRGVIRIEGIFDDVNKATRGTLDGLIDKLNVQFERDISSNHLVNKDIIAEINNARSISKWRRAAVLITYSMVRTLRDGRPSEVDFQRLNADFAGFTTVDETLGSLDAMIEDVEPRVQRFRTRVSETEAARSPLDFPEPDNASVRPKKRKVFRFNESGELSEVK